MHTIRLREAWQTEPSDDGVCYVRKFGLPTNLTTERVYLVVENVAARVELNGKSLGAPRTIAGTLRHEVTGQLAPRNELRIIVTTASGPAGSLGEVRLEIEDVS